MYKYIYISQKSETREHANRKGAKGIIRASLFKKCKIHTKMESGTHHERYRNIRYTNQIL